jgi:aminoglycoside phosphotransferase (APT) family kinase protein
MAKNLSIFRLTIQDALPIKPVEFDGWDNRSFHLGEQMVVRLPSAQEYASQAAKEHRWLPKLAPLLPQPIPVPLAKGKPSEGYPWEWSIYEWLKGETASIVRIPDLCQFASTLGEFLTALQRIDISGGPVAGPQNFYRGGPLSIYDAEARQAMAILGGELDAEAVTAVWDTALTTTWERAPVWIHGDIAAGNLLVDKGRLCAVIDFGCMGIGDPACDLVIAWTLLKGESRDAFRAALKLDRATWARARGWALWKALIVCASLAGIDHNQREQSRRVIDELIADELN